MRKHIYVCSPSAPFDEKRYHADRSISNLNKLGFDVTIASHAFENQGNTSASIFDRLDDLYEGFTNPKYDIVMASRGGWNSNELLPHLDFDLIKKNPKPFFGMSDMTTLCVNLFQKAEIPTVYGQLFLHFGFSDDLSRYQSFVRIVQKIEESKSIINPDISDATVFQKGPLNGRLVGGNLAVLCWLLGTPYALEVPRGSVLFLEDDEETNGFYWQMYLTHLKQAGVFENVSGVIFGTVLQDTQFEKGSSFEDILRTVFVGYDFPIYYNAPFGHIEYPTPLVMGSIMQREHSE